MSDIFNSRGIINPTSIHLSNFSNCQLMVNLFLLYFDLLSPSTHSSAITNISFFYILEISGCNSNPSINLKTFYFFYVAFLLLGMNFKEIGQKVKAT